MKADFLRFCRKILQIAIDNPVGYRQYCITAFPQSELPAPIISPLGGFTHTWHDYSPPYGASFSL